MNNRLKCFENKLEVITKMVETCCMVCHRRLKAQRSVLLGIGPVCHRRLRLGFRGVQMEIGKDNCKEVEKLVDPSRKH